ncbi:MAG: prepilin-type N-terminal cleavage/methylation domain-containing protein [Holdemanella sp.]|nr:prepilin-type N-terminal cleavage/methylation domain-containing protein [Holdemanella sp.]
MKRNNGYTLIECLLGLMVITICIQILCICISFFQFQGDKGIYEEIDEEWFYTP